MTTTPPSESSSNPTEGEAGAQQDAVPPVEGPPAESSALSPVAKMLKGCGCLVAIVILAVGVALVGGGEPASWGSALFGVVILLIMVGSSGLIGWWNR